MTFGIAPSALHDIVIRRLAWAQLYLGVTATLPEDACTQPDLEEIQAVEKVTFGQFIEAAPGDLLDFIKKERVLERLTAEVRIRVRAVKFVHRSDDEQKLRAHRLIEGRVRELEYAWADNVCISVLEPDDEGIDVDICVVGLLAAPRTPRVAEHPDMM